MGKLSFLTVAWEEAKVIKANFFLIQAPENNFFAFIYGQCGKINMRN
jgi:hypothetical protein